ncbi:MAG: PKD domain-containing protein [Candidatus Cloacimonadaceae bacterium]|nr:PKD domain-containing protein [Candidatus Cloacimonadaceae bacterium]
MEWFWASGSGGTGSDSANDIATDSSGNSYVTGVFQGSANFGGTVLDSMGGLDIFIGKMDPLGDWLWAVRAGGSGIDIGNSIAVDSFGNCFVTGTFQSNAGFGSNTLYGSGGDDIFIAKLSTDGNWLWSIEAGGSGDDSGKSIALDAANNCYITGSFNGTAFFSALSVDSMGSTDVFVAKASPTGTWLQAYSAGGMTGDTAWGINLDSSGNCYVTGSFAISANFGSHTVISDGSIVDVFVAKLSPDGIWQWATRGGGVSNDVGLAIVVDDAANCYVTGRFAGNATFGSTNLTAAGGTDIFVAKLNSDGAWQWAVRAGGGGTDIPYSIAHGVGGDVYITGYYNGIADFGSTNISSAGGLDVFLAKLDGAGEWQWAVSAGGAGGDYANGVAIDSNGNCLVVGGFTTSISPSYFGSHEMSSWGSDDVFVAKYGEAVPALTVNPVTYDFGSAVVPGSNGTVFINCFFNSASTAAGAYLVSAVLTGDDVFTLSPDMTNATGGPVPGLPTYIYGSDMVVFEVIFEPSSTNPAQAVLTLTDEFASTYTTTITAYSGTVSSDPLIQVSPTEITRSIPLNASQNGSFKIFNQGGGDLNFSIISTGAPYYFSLNPMVGTVAPGDSTAVQYSISSVGMAAGTYNSSIEINSNDPGTPVKILPTNITVLSEVALFVDPTSHDFGICQLDETYQYGILIEAWPDGRGTVQIQDIQIIGSYDWDFYVENHPSIPFSMTSGETDYIWVAFTPSFPMNYTAQLVITSSNGIQYIVNLSGSGRASDLITDPSTYHFWDTIVPGETGQVVINVKRNPVSPNSIVVVDHAEILPSSAVQFQFMPDIFNAAGNPVSLPYALGTLAPDSLFFTVMFQPDNTSFQYAKVRFADEFGFTAVTHVDAFGGGITWDPEIAVLPDSVDIYINQDSVQSGTFLIRNVGGGTLDYQISPTGLPPNVSLNNTSGSLASGSSATIIYTVNSSGMAVGYDERTLSIQSNDPTNPFVEFRMNIYVMGEPVTANFSAAPLSGHVPLTVVFDDQSIVDASLTSTTLTAWRWDFDNDGIIDSYQQNPTHVYTQPGVYSVRLTVMTNNGQFASETKLNYITAGNQAPVVHTPLDLVSDMLEDTPWGPVLLSNHFSDPDGDPLQYTAQNSAHISVVFFAGTSFQLTSAQDWYGTESVSITATDPFGASVTMTILVTVLPVNDAPVLNVPPNFHFIRNSTFVVDFAPFINDPDNQHADLSISLQRVLGQGVIHYEYRPVNEPNVLGQFLVAFTSPMQTSVMERFRISVNDNMGRLISEAVFNMYLLEQFTVQFGANSTTAAPIAYAGQTINFKDNTLGNPDWWNWEIRKQGIVVTTSNLQNPAITLNEAGTYSVRLQLGNYEAQEEAFYQIFNMFTLTGTAVDPDAYDPVWDPAGSPYNIYGSLAVNLNQTLNIQNNVVVNLFLDTPLNILGTLNANGARFQPQTGNGRWRGFRFLGGGRPVESELIDCEIIDALEPLYIENSSPTLQSLTIAITDTLEIIDGTALKIGGNAAPTIDDLDISSYKIGIEIEPGADDRTTPVLTNIRVRNTQDTSRDDTDPSIGIYVRGDVEIDDAVVENFDTGIKFEGSDDYARTTPTLTNIRVRNTQDTSRGSTYGITVTGNIVPNMHDVTVEETDYGIKLIGGSVPNRTTPVLTNIRVRNTQDTSRLINSGLLLENISSVEIDSLEVEGFSHGIVITSDTRDLSTPTLTNIRVRNTQDTSRTETIGMLINGAVALNMDGAEFDDFFYGIKYQGAPLRDLSTPTLTNIRVRNTQDTSRQSSIGIQLIDISRVIMDNDSIVGYSVGLQITTGGMRDVSTPVLTNIRVRNTQDTSRMENVGIFLGPGVAGYLQGADVYGARIGILIADGNRTVLKPNVIRNCEIGMRAAGINTLPIRRQLIILDPWFQSENPLWNFCAMELNLPGPWLVENNTINGYPKALKANQAGVLFRNNIAWASSPMQMPFELISSTLLVDHCDVATIGVPYPGIGNLNVDPQYENIQMGDYRLSCNSPLIDAGSPLVPLDSDGSVSDIGAFTYLHRVSMTPSYRFVQTGTTVNFLNTSIGHDYPYTQIEWDLHNDGLPDATSRDWSHQFNTPGIYDLRLRMTSGGLVDERVYQAAIIVQDNILQPPQNVQIWPEANSIVLDWDAVEFTLGGDPVSVEFYVLYTSETPTGYFDFAGSTQDFATIFVHQEGALRPHAFYFILGFVGSRGELIQFIESNPRFLIPENDQGGEPRRKK